MPDGETVERLRKLCAEQYTTGDAYEVWGSEPILGHPEVEFITRFSKKADAERAVEELTNLGDTNLEIRHVTSAMAAAASVDAYEVWGSEPGYPEVIMLMKFLTPTAKEDAEQAVELLKSIGDTNLEIRHITTEK